VSFQQFPCHCHSTSSPVTVIPPVTPVRVIPPVPLSVSFHQFPWHSHSTSCPVTLIPPVPCHCQSTSSPVTVIPSMLHAHSFTYCSPNLLSNWQRNQLTCCHSLPPQDVHRSRSCQPSAQHQFNVNHSVCCGPRVIVDVCQFNAFVCVRNMLVSSRSGRTDVRAAVYQQPADLYIVWCDKRGCLYWRISCVQSIPISEFSDKFRLLHLSCRTSIPPLCPSVQGRPEWSV